MRDIKNSFQTIEPKWLYRLESVSEDNGLWYNSNNEFVWGITNLPDCETKNLPMGYDERYHKDGRNWFSSCSRKEDLMHWYSVKDATDLIANGFVFTRYLATEYVEYELETTFIKETALAREEISIEELFCAAEKPCWISTGDRFPDADRFLYISRFNNSVYLGEKRSFDKNWIVGGLNIRKDIRFWMPLPEPPNQEETGRRKK